MNATQNPVSRMVMAVDLLASAASAARGDEVLYQKALRSVTYVVNRDGTCAGSGTLVDARRRWVVTNHHVVAGARGTVQVHFPVLRDGLPVQDVNFYAQRPAIAGRILLSDPTRDVAVVELESLPAGAAAMPLAERSPMPGSRVHLVGNGVAVGAAFAYEEGRIRAVSRRRFVMTNGQQLDALMVTSDLPINPGDSGSALFNDRGEVVAVVHSGGPTAGQLVTNATDVTEVRAALAPLEARRGDGRDDLLARNPVDDAPAGPARGVGDGEVLRRLVAEAPARQAAIREGVTSRSGVLRLRTLAEHFGHCGRDEQLAIRALFFAGDERTRGFAREQLRHAQRGLVSEMASLSKQLRTATASEQATIRQRVVGLARNAVEIGDALTVADQLGR